MVANNPLLRGANAGALRASELEQPIAHAGQDLSDAIVMRVFQRSQSDRETTIRDLHQSLGLQLPEVYAALRALESRKIIDILDNPSDPFGATLRLHKSTDEALRHGRIDQTQD